MKLQEKDSNLNISFTDKIDLKNDLFAFIDESGDDGFDFSNKGASRWFNVSAFIAKPDSVNEMVADIEKYRETYLPQKTIEKMSSKDLKHNHKKGIFLTLSKYDFITTHSLFYKPDINPHDRLVVYPSMYFVGIKNVIERITWCVKQSGKRIAHVLISNRNNIKSLELQNYLFKYSFVASKNLCYLEKLGIVKLTNFNLRPQLLLADYSAYTLRFVFEEIGNPPAPEPYYYEMFQKGKLFYSEHPKYTGVWGNGLKVTPNDHSLIHNGDILNEGTHKI
jgi:hypothetical protein